MTSAGAGSTVTEPAVARNARLAAGRRAADLTATDRSATADAATTDTATTDLEVSVVLPCLDEARTLGTCIDHARRAMAAMGVHGEVVVADNGSTDDSRGIATRAGARVVDVPERGYGAALRAGIAAARGRYVVMADADDSYALEDLAPFVERLRTGEQLVMGNRFAGGIAPGAMPALHRHLGNPVLSGIGRLLFGVPVRDFHCGMRGFDREAVAGLGLRSSGMEFASEMVVKASLAGLRIGEVPTTLRPDGRDRPPHLRSWRDGWRHLRFLLLFSPRWLFLYPGVLLAALSAALMLRLVWGPLVVAGAELDVQGLVFASAGVVVGVQSVIFAVLARTYAGTRGLLPVTRRLTWAARSSAVEVGALAGLALVVVGLVGLAGAFLGWASTGFGELDASTSLRLSVPAATGVVVGAQIVLSSFFLGLLQLDGTLAGRPAPSPAS